MPERRWPRSAQYNGVDYLEYIPADDAPLWEDDRSKVEVPCAGHFYDLDNPVCYVKHFTEHTAYCGEMKFTKVMFRREICNWFRERNIRCVAEYRYELPGLVAVIHFTNTKDAMLFKLTWS